MNKPFKFSTRSVTSVILFLLSFLSLLFLLTFPFFSSFKTISAADSWNESNFYWCRSRWFHSCKISKSKNVTSRCRWEKSVRSCHVSNERKQYYKLDVVIGTHPHSGHLDGLIKILKKVPVDQVYDSGIKYHTRAYKDYMRAVEKEQIPFSLTKDGHDIDRSEGWNSCA